MHHYPFHIKDYLAHTLHLSEREDLAYRRMLDYIHLHEKPLPKNLELVAKRIRMPDAMQEITSVVQEFFDETENGYIQKRCQQTIDSYKKMSEGGKKGAKKRWEENNRANSPLNGAPNNPKIGPSIATNNHKPITNKINKPDSVSEDVWNDFLQHRKARKSAVTERVINSITKEAKKAGWTLEDTLTEIVTRGWNSFKADWVTKQQQPEMTWE